MTHWWRKHDLRSQHTRKGTLLLGVLLSGWGMCPHARKVYAGYAGSRSSAKREKKSEVEGFTPASIGIRVGTIATRLGFAKPLVSPSFAVGNV